MKKFINITLALSLAGAVLSGILLYQHFFPDSGLSMATCGKGMHNACLAVSMSPFATVLGVPVAAYGLFYFLFLLFSALIADYAGTPVRRAFQLVLLASSIMALAGDLVLAGLLVHLRAFCSLCVATYGINAALAVTALVWYRGSAREEGLTPGGIIRDILPGQEDAFRKGFSAVFFLFTGLLAFAVFSTSYNLKLKTEEFAVSEAEVKQFMKEYEGYKAEKLDLPAPQLTMGPEKARVRIVAFTDFLCSACYAFYKVEKYIVSRYGNQVRLEYYSYPLDQECNKGMDRSMYPGSCLASRAMLAAREDGIFEEYLVNHFAGYKEHKKHYETRTVQKILAAAVKDSGRKVDAAKFMNRLNSSVARDIVRDEIAAADSLGINGTPTIFINGKRLPGMVPREIFDAIIARELQSR